MSERGVAKMIKKHYTWNDVETAANSIIAQMCKDQWYPDYIVGITRGGLPLALLLSQKLDCRMETLKVKLRDAKDGEQCETNLWMADDAFGILEDDMQAIFKSRWDISARKKILVVDDINDSGATFNWVKKDWQSSCFPNEEHVWNSIWNKSVRFAVMTDNLSSEFQNCNYAWDEVNKSEDNIWLVYPWEQQ